MNDIYCYEYTGTSMINNYNCTYVFDKMYIKYHNFSYYHSNQEQDSLMAFLVISCP